MANWKLRKASLADAEALAACIDRAYFAYSSRIDDLPEVSDGIDEEIANHTVWVADQGGKVIGGLILVIRKNHAQLVNVAVDPDHSGNGLGKALLECAQDECRKLQIPSIRLSTHIKMPENVSLYEHLGWHETGRVGNKVQMEKTVEV
jgi:N-acetylglutamate synthase-like GNAT family acetyltransferase